jgi:hypothetical protein
MLRRLPRDEALERARPYLPIGLPRDVAPQSEHEGWWSWTFEFEGDEPDTDPNWIIVHVNRFSGRVSFTPTE